MIASVFLFAAPLHVIYITGARPMRFVIIVIALAL